MSTKITFEEALNFIADVLPETSADDARTAARALSDAFVWEQDDLTNNRPWVAKKTVEFRTEIHNYAVGANVVQNRVEQMMKVQRMSDQRRAHIAFIDKHRDTVNALVQRMRDVRREPHGAQPEENTILAHIVEGRVDSAVDAWMKFHDAFKIDVPLYRAAVEYLTPQD